MERQFLGVWIPKEIYLHKGLTPTEKLLLAEIASFSKNGICFASNEHFSEFLGVSKKHVSRLISKLVVMGLVSVDLVYKEGTKEVDKRTITPVYIKEDTPIHIEGDTPPHTGGHPHHIQEDTPPHTCVDPLPLNAYYKEHNKIQDKEQVKKQDKDKTTNNNKLGISPKKLEEEFELLWKIYPRKLGKKKAFDSFKNARKLKKIPYETIENGLYRYIEYLKTQGMEEQFIMHGSTWFNQNKWLDEYETSHFEKKPQLSRFTQMALNEMDDPDDFLNLLGVNSNYEQGRNRKIITDGEVPLSPRL